MRTHLSLRGQAHCIQRVGVLRIGDEHVEVAASSAIGTTWNCFMNFDDSDDVSGGSSGASFALSNGRSSTAAAVSA